MIFTLLYLQLFHLFYLYISHLKAVSFSSSRWYYLFVLTNGKEGGVFWFENLFANSHYPSQFYLLMLVAQK